MIWKIDGAHETRHGHFFNGHGHSRALSVWIFGFIVWNSSEEAILIIFGAFLCILGVSITFEIYRSGVGLR